MAAIMAVLPAVQALTPAMLASEDAPPTYDRQVDMANNAKAKAMAIATYNNAKGHMTEMYKKVRDELIAEDGVTYVTNEAAARKVQVEWCDAKIARYTAIPDLAALVKKYTEMREKFVKEHDKAQMQLNTLTAAEDPKAGCLKTKSAKGAKGASSSGGGASSGGSGKAGRKADDPAKAGTVVVAPQEVAPGLAAHRQYLGDKGLLQWVMTAKLADGSTVHLASRTPMVVVTKAELERKAPPAPPAGAAPATDGTAATTTTATPAASADEATPERPLATAAATTSSGGAMDDEPMVELDEETRAMFDAAAAPLDEQPKAKGGRKRKAAGGDDVAVAAEPKQRRMHRIQQQ